MQPTEPEVLDYQAKVDAFYPPDAVDAPVEQQRRWYDALCRAFDVPRPAGVTTCDGAVAGTAGPVPIRRYRPPDHDDIGSKRSNVMNVIDSNGLERDAGGKPVPTFPHPAPSAGRGATILWLHGGGFVVGSLDSHDAICAEICAATGAEVVAADYRLAPEDRWPASFEDCRAVLRHLADEGRAVVLAGDSAGANLAAGLALLARDEGLAAVVGQALVYPGLGGDLTAGSYVEMSTAPGLTTADVGYYRAVNGAAEDDLHAYPLRVPDLAGLAPAFITVARFDPLRDDGRTYAARLASAGVDVMFREEPQMIHAWLRARHMSPGARRGFVALCDGLGALAQRLPLT